MVRPGLASLLHRTFLALCLLLVAQVPHAAAGSVRLYWDANTEQDLAGYVLVWGSSSGVYTQSATLAPDAVTHEVASLPEGTWYFAIRAFNTSGLHSGYSNEVQVVISPPAVSTPSITSVAPASGPTAGGTDVTLLGGQFQPGAVVRIGTQVATVISQGSTTLVVRTPAGTAGATSVSVTNPDGGVATLAAAFTYVAPPLRPDITGFTPTSGPTTGGTQVTVTGANFQPGLVVRFGTTVATTESVSPTTVVVRTPAHAAGNVAITVQNPDGAETQATQSFTYTTPPALPSISSFSPSSGSTSGGTEVVITGANFQNGIVVRFGSLAAAVTSVTTTRLVVRTPAQAKGTVALSVVNPDGNGVQIANAFTYRGRPPSVTSVSPSVGDAAGGTQVVLDGADFESGIGVSVNSVPAVVLSVTPTRVVVRMPAHAPATVGLTVTNPDSQFAWVPAAFTDF